MSEQKKLEELIIKYFSRAASAADMEDLDVLLEEKANRAFFKEYVKINYATDIHFKDFNAEQVRKELLKKINDIEKKESQSRLLRMVSRYAAVAVVAFGIGFFAYKQFLEAPSDQLIIPQEKITLEFEDGTIETLFSDVEKDIVSQQKVIGKQNGSVLRYQQDTTVATLEYHTIRVPYGKRFSLELSDGTSVQLNAGSRLRYPVAFLNEGKREVFLQGEAFFDVAHNEENPFLVGVGELNVKVLGTQFNVASYAEDVTSQVVLVKGSVGLYADTANSKSENGTLLEPGFMGSYNKNDGTVDIAKVNTSLFTSWTTGKVVFRNASFDNILKKLERQYNVTIENRDPDLANVTFNASLDVNNETIEEVLAYFGKLYDIQYRVANNTIIIE